MGMQQGRGVGLIIGGDGSGGSGPPGPPGPAAGLLGVQVIRATGDYTPSSPDVEAIFVELVGGGGGGGSAGDAVALAPYVGGGGGSGGYAAFFTAITPSTPIPVVIGAGGAGGAAGGMNAGASGGNSSMLGIGALGGGGGAAVGGGSGQPFAGGGAGGATSGAPSTINTSVGQPGTYGYYVISSGGPVASAGGGNGGNGPWGGGGRGRAHSQTQGAGGDGGGPGAGGGGAWSAAPATFKGGDGAGGVAIIYEYGPGSGGGGAVDSVFGRTGVVTAQPGDYDTDQITNTSTVPGATLTDALDSITALLTILSNWAVPSQPSFSFNSAVYDSGADPFGGQTAVSLVLAYTPNQLSGAFQVIGGTHNGVGGLRIVQFQNTILVNVFDGGGVERTVFANIPSVRFWQLVGVRIDATGADLVVDLFVNGSRVASDTFSGGGGALPAGGDFTLGASPGGADPANDVFFVGAGYAARLANNAEFAGQFISTVTGGTFGDLAGNFDAAWQLTGGDPGNPWASFVGVVPLARTGPAVSYMSGGVPLYR